MYGVHELCIRDSGSFHSYVMKIVYKNCYSVMTFSYRTRTDNIMIMHAYMFWLHIEMEDITPLFACGQYRQNVYIKNVKVA